MKRTVLGVVTAVLALSSTASVVHAQNPMTFGIAAGATIPMGDLGDVYGTGFHGMVTLGFMPSMLPFGMRIDGSYNSLGSKDEVGDFTARVISVTANGVFAMPGMMASPYLIGGLGFYNGDDDRTILGAETESSNDFGINVGLGAKFSLSGFGTFAEIRYHNIFTEENSTQYLPITFGIMF